MTSTQTWQDKAATIGIVLFVLGVCLFLVKSLSFKALYGRHDNILVVCSEAGFIASVSAFALILLERRPIRRAILVIASLVLSYLFFSSITWWVMVK